jgi:hypothetical protein
MVIELVMRKDDYGSNRTTKCNPCFGKSPKTESERETFASSLTTISILSLYLLFYQMEGFTVKHFILTVDVTTTLLPGLFG